MHMQAVGNAAQAAVALPLCSGGGNGPSSERSTGSHASEPPSASLGSQLSSEPSGSPAAGGCGSGASGRGCALDHGLLNLAAAAEQGETPGPCCNRILSIIMPIVVYLMILRVALSQRFAMRS